MRQVFQYETKSDVSTGFKVLDSKIHGFRKGELIVIAAFSCMGKSSLLYDMALDSAIKQGKSTALLICDRTRERAVGYLLSLEASLCYYRLHDGRISEPEWDRLNAASKELVRSKLVVDDCYGFSIPSIQRRVDAYKRNYDLDVVFIDELCWFEEYQRADRSSMGVITKELKRIARESQVVIVATVQLSRTLAEREDHRPVLSNLDVYGELKASADSILLIHRESVWDKNAPDGNKTEIIIAKTPMGTGGTVLLKWNPDLVRFDK